MKVSVYELLEPEKIAQNKDAIRLALSKESSGRPIDLNFHLSPNSGCFKFFDEKKIWKNDKPLALPKKLNEIIKVVSEYFQNVNQRIADFRRGSKIINSDLPDPFPKDLLSHQFSYPMIKSGDTFPDHWISNWMLFLPAMVDDEINNGHKFPVYGGNVEVRIGSNFQIVGLVSNLRPWTRSFNVEGFHHSDSHHEKHHEHPPFFFVSDSPTEQQNFLAPFYHQDTKATSHHGSAIAPSCMFALLINIGIIQDDKQKGVKLFAMVMDSEGNMVPVTNKAEWKKDWLYKKMGSVFLTDPVKSKNETIHLETTGVYHVELLIEHIPTGVCRTTYKQVAVGGINETKDKLNLIS